MSLPCEQSDYMSVPVGDETVSCALVTKGPSLEELNAAILRYTSVYMWEHEGFVLKRHEDAPCPWLERAQQDSPMPGVLWAQFRHEGSIEDEWFTVFLVTRLTELFKDEVIAQVWSSDGQFMLIEAAELLPKWVDSSQHGSLDSISRNRVWIHRGVLHLIPLHTDDGSVDLSCKGLTFSVAARAVFDSTISTEAPERIQKYLHQRQLSLYPTAIRKHQQRSRVLLPRPAACVLLKRPKLAAAAARAFLNRSPKDMQSALQKKEFWMSTKCSDIASENKQLPQMDTCTLLLRRSHYAGLVGTTFAAPKGYVIPPPGTPTHKAAMLGLKLSLGLQMYSDRLHSELDGKKPEGGEAQHGGMISSQAGQRFLSALQTQGCFRGSIEGSQEYQRLYGLAEDAWKASGACRDAQLATQLQADELDAARRSGVTDEELRDSAHMAEDSDKWMEEEFQMRLDRYHSQADASTSAAPDHRGVGAEADATSGAGQSVLGSSALAEAGNEDEMEAEDLLGRLSRFMEGSSGVSGAKPDPSSFSLDVNALMALLTPPGGAQGLDAGVGGALSDDSASEGLDAVDSDDDDDDADGAVAVNTCSNDSAGAGGALDQAGIARRSNGDESRGVGPADSRCVLHVGDNHSAGASKAEQSDSIHQEPQKSQQSGESFMAEYMQHLDEELKQNASDDLKGVSVDMSCVADLLQSVEAGTGQPGAADGLLGMLGMRVPKSSS